MVDYIWVIYMYDVYKLSYKRPIFNALTTIIQLIDFLMQHMKYFFIEYIYDHRIMYT